ncbi:MAG: hypothetical protein RLY31_499 [Bacteroidota bacterium]|jgi:hypothetical protein
MLKFLPRLFLFLVPFTATDLNGQADISFVATTHSKQILQDGILEVTFTLSNANGTNFIAPDFNQFKLVSGPFRSSSMQVTNGVVTSQMTYSYSLRPKKSGTLTIRPAKITVRNKTLITNSLSIEVLESSKTLPADDQPYLVRLEINASDEIYPGQQLLLDYKLYTTLSIEGYDFLEDAKLNGFYATELRDFSSLPTRESLNGKQYTTKILRRVVIYPQKSGKLNIIPAQIQLAIPEQEGRSRFFFNRNIRTVLVSTNSLEINVQSLPPNPPSTFTGAVGKFQCDITSDRTSLSTDEALTLKISYAGYGDLKRITVPEIVVPTSLERYPANITEEYLTETASGILGHRTIEYVIVPKSPGTFDISAGFSFFNPDNKQFEQFELQTATIEVLPGPAKQAILTNDSTQKQDVNTDIRPIKPTGQLQLANNHIIKQPLYWLAALFAALLFLFANILRYYGKRKKSKRGSLSNDKLKIEINRLKNLQYIQQASSEDKSFYETIAGAVGSYIRIKFDIPPSKYSKMVVADSMKEQGLPEKWVDDYLYVMQLCEAAMFAGEKIGISRETLYQKATELIDNLENRTGSTVSKKSLL